MCVHVCGKCCFYNPQKKRAAWPTKKKKTKGHTFVRSSFASKWTIFLRRETFRLKYMFYYCSQYIHARKRHAVQLFVTESFKGNAVIKWTDIVTAQTGHVPVHEIINSLCIKEQLWKRPCIKEFSHFIRKKNQNSALQVTVHKINTLYDQ